MLIRLEIRNFYSVRDKQVLDLSLPATSPHDVERFVYADASKKLRVPKVTAIFGANASGKTTILRAIEFIADFVINSFSSYKPDDRINVFPFASEEFETDSTDLSIEFIPHRVFDNAIIKYRYELSIKHARNSNYVSREALKVSRNGKKSVTAFERVGDDIKSNVEPAKIFGIGSRDPRLNVRPNVSLISSLNQFAHPFSQDFIHAMRVFQSNIVINKIENDKNFATGFYKSFPDVLRSLNKMIRIMDVGVEKVELGELGGKAVPLFHHTGLSHPQIYELESQGTRNFYCIFPILSISLHYGGVAVMDEVDSDIHALLMPEIVRWFHDKTHNPYSAQLVMTCHSATLLESLAKEEVWFTEKGAEGQTILYSLRNVRGVRRDENIYSKYLGGVYGAIPRIG